LCSVHYVDKIKYDVLEAGFVFLLQVKWRGTYSVESLRWS